MTPTFDRLKFTYHVVNIKLTNSPSMYKFFDIFTYHVVNIKQIINWYMFVNFSIYISRS